MTGNDVSSILIILYNLMGCVCVCVCQFCYIASRSTWYASRMHMLALSRVTGTTHVRAAPLASADSAILLVTK